MPREPRVRPEVAAGLRKLERTDWSVYPLVSFKREPRPGRMAAGHYRTVIDFGRGLRPLRASFWWSSRKPQWGVERRREQHQVRYHFGRWHLTVGHFVWRSARGRTP